MNVTGRYLSKLALNIFVNFYKLFILTGQNTVFSPGVSLFNVVNNAIFDFFFNVKVVLRVLLKNSKQILVSVFISDCFISCSPSFPNPGATRNVAWMSFG